MAFQTALILIFLLNATIIWLSVFMKKGALYRPIGIVIWTFIIVYLPFISQARFTINIFIWQIIGTAILLSGTTIAVFSWIKFLKAGVQPYSANPAKLIKDGPYKTIRHPQYLALIIIFIGIAVARGAILSLYLAPFIILFHWLEAFLEEKFVLEKQFPQEYKKYKKTTGMFLPKIK